MRNGRAQACGGADDATVAVATAVRKRPKPGERRVQILQTLACMLEQPGAERVTTAALAARLEVSEAALYRHFASKAQMFEGLIEFIEQSVFTLVNQIGEREPDPRVQVQKVLGVVLTLLPMAIPSLALNGSFGALNGEVMRLVLGASPGILALQVLLILFPCCA